VESVVRRRRGSHYACYFSRVLRRDRWSQLGLWAWVVEDALLAAAVEDEAALVALAADVTVLRQYWHDTERHSGLGTYYGVPRHPENRAAFVRWLAARYPERVSHLVLWNGFARDQTHSAAPRMRALFEIVEVAHRPSSPSCCRSWASARR